MELLKLKYFTTVALESSMQQAADSLHVSQSTLSTAIKNLETELGVELFHKSGRKLELTQAGQILLADASDLLAQAENIQHRMKLLQPTDEQTVCIGTEAQDFTSEAVLRFRSRKGTDLHLTRYQPRRSMIKPLLSSAQLDFAITLFDDSDSGVESTLLLEEPYYLQVSRTHPLHDQKRVHFAQLERETLVTISEYYGFRILCESFFGMAGVRPLAYHVVADYETIPLFVRNGYGISLIPRSTDVEMRDWLNYLCRLEIDESFCARKVYLTRLRDKPLSAPAQEFADFLMEFADWTQQHGRFPD